MTAAKGLPQMVIACFCTVNHENIFIAKIRDSESARPCFCVSKRLAISANAHDAYREAIAEIAAAQGFPALLTNADAGRSGLSRIAISTHCIAIADDAARAPTSQRQHFLKWTLFFSMCWCIRDEVHLDSRVHAANEVVSLHQEGNMAKKAKKSKKKAKSAVKKTAKKTRRVKKKKNMNM